MISKISTTPIQHWLNTPRSSYYGYPTYGNAFEALLYKNKNDLTFVINIIVDMMIENIGLVEASKVKQVEISKGSEDLDLVAVIMLLQDGSLGGFKVVKDRT